jgi:tryptophanyl-tRNA synthetase
VLEPIQAAYAALDPAEVTARFEAGEAVCREVTEPVLAAARTAIGL